MLTRIEIDGFKTFDCVALDVPPFLVILGPNAAGKSNLFDAIRFLSQLATSDLRTACRGLRGEPHELFRRDSKGDPGSRMRLAVEVIAPGREATPRRTRLRSVRVDLLLGLDGGQIPSNEVERYLATVDAHA